MNGWLDRWMDGWMEGQMDKKQVEQKGVNQTFNTNKYDLKIFKAKVSQ